MFSFAELQGKRIAIVASAVLIGGALVFGGYTILDLTADRIIAKEAERSAEAWADYAGSELVRIEAIASGAAPNADEQAFLTRLRSFGDVFRFKLFDAQGRIRLVSDDLNSVVERAANLGEHNPKAASVVRTGVPYTSIEDGTAKPDRPDVYVESYVPVARNGKTVAIVEVYVDQTAQAAAVRTDFRTFGIKIMGLTVLVLILPFMLLVLMVRRQRVQNAELAMERDKAQSARRAKSEFLANMSHEIRTPLNGVLGMAGLLAGTKLNDDQREYTETIVQSGESLLTVLNDILDFSKIEAGKIDLEESVFQTISLLDSAVGLLAAQAHGKGLEIPTFVAPDVPRKLVGDDGRIRQVLLNLIGNAIKFTEKGGVSVELSVQDRPTDDGSILLRFEIRDTGIGIPEAMRDHLFDEFYQVDGSNRRHYEGTGLGLAICKRLTDMMGGEIGMDAHDAGGSLFWFTVRVRQHDVVESWATEIGSVLQGRRILVVDDNEVNRLVFERQLAALGAVVMTAMNAESALAKIRAAIDSGKPFDGAIIDHFMPGTDGLDLVKMIQQTAGAEGIKLVFSSSSGEYNSDNSVKPLGFDVSLPKPLRPGGLLRCANKIFNGVSAADVPETGATLLSSPLARSNLNILVAEDNHANQQLIRAILKGNGYNIQFAANGVEAIEAARKLPFDLILMDIRMPEMDGIEATRNIRQLSNENGQVPIIGVTANALKGDRETVIQAGMNDYLSKPINANELFEKIAFWTDQAQSGQHTGPKKGVDAPEHRDRLDVGAA